ncbi:GlxA family transcriptional regulator [Nocardiopsis trehalosi]|uniref:GlxA family transcriptional regulator n=1 Tax=Nocardiopsis trehalosi TaxID=109329 RepID=UPI000A0773D1|nr:helix-turn-helix domain-containing protein [Nocardiopsis trehalosi]
MSAGTVAIAVIDDRDLAMWDVYELGIACAVFGVPRPELHDPWYRIRLCAVSGEGAPDGSGLALRTPYGPDDLVGADTVIVPSVPDPCVAGDRELPEELLTALRRAAAGGARMVSMCTGAYALGAAGLLDGRRATAHWSHTADLAARFPEAEFDPSVLYVDDGDVLTSAGVSAGLDLCLHLVRRDLGAHVANQVARGMVVPAHRAGGQAQFIDLAVPAAADDGLAPVLEWAVDHLDLPLTVDGLARRAGMSPRTFYRRLRAATGTTPLQWLLDQRLARAQSLLEATDLPVERIGEASGLGSAANLRRHFLQHVGVTPTEYRRAFPARPDVPEPPEAAPPAGGDRSLRAGRPVPRGAARRRSAAGGSGWRGGRRPPTAGRPPS